MRSKHLWFGRRPSAQRLCAVWLIVLQAILLWKLLSGGPFALLIVLLALAGATAQPGRMLPKFDLARWSLVLSVLFLIKSRYWPHEIGPSDGFVYSQYAYEISCALMAIQVMILWGSEYVQRLPVVMVALAGMGLIFIGDVRLTSFERVLTSLFAGLYCVLAVQFAALARTSAVPERTSSLRWRTIMWVGAVVVGSLLGQASGFWLYRNEQHLELMLANLIEPDHNSTNSGFTAEVGLGSSSWLTGQDDRLALKISGTSQPQYLKGQSLNTYRRSQWTSTRTMSPIDPIFSGPLRAYEFPDARTYSLASGEVRPVSKVLDVWPQPSGKSVYFFMPESTMGLVTMASDLMEDGVGNVHRRNSSDEQRYRLLLDDAPSPEVLSKVDRRSYLKLPRRLDDRVFDTAVEVFRDCNSFEQRIQSVESYFQENFKYRLGIRVPDEEDPLGWFLGNRIPAHCEYFATATAVLLRLEGIPARLATGYVAAEWNPSAELLLARRKDAHAWVEAYNESTGHWVIVESTPADGLPQPRETQGFDALGQSLQHQGMQWIEATQLWLQEGNIGLAVSYLLLAISLIGAIAVAIATRRRWLSWFVLDRGSSEIPPELRRERKRLDRRLARLGLGRGDSETLHQFADRIEATVADDWGHRAATCYRLYARLRYDPTLDASQSRLEELTRLRKFL